LGKGDDQVAKALEGLQRRCDGCPARSGTDVDANDGRGSKRPVKFDGIQGDYVIDRKWKVVDAPHARAQLLRQSEVLAEHRLIGTWEVPTPAQKAKALKLFKR
jgi:hypothetical protein